MKLADKPLKFKLMLPIDLPFLDDRAFPKGGSAVPALIFGFRAVLTNGPMGTLGFTVVEHRAAGQTPEAAAV